MRIIADIEADNLIENVTKIHCMCYYDIDTHESVSLTDYEQIKELLATPNLTIIGHYFVQYDAVVLKKILNIDFKARLIDTLGLSWYLYPSRLKHGLAEWGEDLGTAKPPIESWSGDTEEERALILNRCEQDVIINTKLFNLQLEYLKKIYNNDMAAIGRFMDYISFKLDCAREQEEVKIKIDVKKAKENLLFLEAEKLRKMDILSDIMPKHNIYKVKSKPKVMFKKDGSVSSHGQDWFDLLKEQGLPDYHLGALKLIAKQEKGNPGSHQQLKDWLFSLGWQPDVFKYVKEEKEGEVYTAMNKQTTRAVPQISVEDGSELSDSVKDLFEVEPKLIELDSFFKIRHRIGCINAFLEKMDDNHFVKAEIAGLTNTLRFKHAKPVVNMPSSPKKYWEMVRGCIIAPDDNHTLCGADMSSLEDNTKQHYMMFFDPEYVKEMRTPGFDPHVDIAKLAKHMSHDEGEFFKWYDKKSEGKIYNYHPAKEGTDKLGNSLLPSKWSFEHLVSVEPDLQKKVFKQLKDIRLKDKKTNFAAVYGAGAAKIALTAKIPLPQAKDLWTIYWQRNKSVKQIAEAVIHKTVDGQMWLFNPVSKFWYSLRYEKDKFSTLNQGTGVYCFDMWIKHVRQQQIKVAMQYHDEKLSITLKGQETIVTKKLELAIHKVNEEIKLNVPLAISIKYGSNYADVH